MSKKKINKFILLLENVYISYNKLYNIIILAETCYNVVDCVYNIPRYTT